MKHTKMDPLSTLNPIREIIEKSTDPELAKLILDLQNRVSESQNLRLRADLVNLKQQLDLRARMHMRQPFNYYFQDGDGVPFCPNAGRAGGKKFICQCPNRSSVESGRTAGIVRKPTGRWPSPRDEAWLIASKVPPRCLSAMCVVVIRRN